MTAIEQEAADRDMREAFARYLSSPDFAAAVQAQLAAMVKPREGRVAADNHEAETAPPNFLETPKVFEIRPKPDSDTAWQIWMPSLDCWERNGVKINASGVTAADLSWYDLDAVSGTITGVWAYMDHTDAESDWYENPAGCVIKFTATEPTAEYRAWGAALKLAVIDVRQVTQLYTGRKVEVVSLTDGNWYWSYAVAGNQIVVTIGALRHGNKTWLTYEDSYTVTIDANNQYVAWRFDPSQEGNAETKRHPGLTVAAVPFAAMPEDAVESGAKIAYGPLLYMGFDAGTNTCFVRKPQRGVVYWQGFDKDD